MTLDESVTTTDLEESLSTGTYAAIIIVSLIMLFIICLFLSLYIRRVSIQRKMDHLEK